MRSHSAPADPTPPSPRPSLRQRLTPHWVPSISPRPPIFADASGRRWRRVRTAAASAAVLLTVIAGAALALGLATPAEHGLGARLLGARLLAGRGGAGAPDPTGAPERPAAGRRVRRGADVASPAFRPDDVTLARLTGGAPTAAGDPLTVGFYVNWDENSRVSLERNLARLDWVVAEWVFLEASGDSLRVTVDERVPRLLARVPAAERPRLLAMVTNVDVATRHFDPVRVRRLVGDSARRARAVARLADLVRRYALGGITLDLEAYPADLDAGVARFTTELRAALRPLGAVVTATVGADVEPARAARLAAPNDHVFLMLYDEHWSTSGAGPVASQGWFARRAAAYLRHVPRPRPSSPSAPTATTGPAGPPGRWRG
jgi:hypothetical protein